MSDEEIDWEALRQPEQAYPPWIESTEARRRWDLSAAIARELFPEPGSAADIWMATRSIYQGPWKTGEARGKSEST